MSDLGGVVMESMERNTGGASTGLARYILTQGVLLGILADAILRRTGAGYGLTLWVVAVALTAAVLWHSRGTRLGREQMAWLGCAVALAGAYAWRDAELLRAANVGGVLISLALFAMVSAAAPAPSVFAARVRDVLAGWLYAARDAAIGVVPLVLRDSELPATLARTTSAGMPVLRAALLTVPILVVFGALLGSADPVFGSVFRLPGVDFETAVSHVMVAGFFAWITSGWMRGALLQAGRRAAPPVTLPFTLRAIDVSAALGTLVLLFALFVGLQARWLFGGADVVLATTGLSLAEYARGGFFELVWVAVLVLPLILVSRAAIGDDPGALRIHRQLSLALLLLLGAIMASAVHRMQLYVGYFGLSVDRLYALVFMGWLALVFMALAATVLRGWPRPFAAVALMSGFLAVGALNVANPEAIVARTNLARQNASTAVDYEYLARLSGDAAPIVASALAVAEPSGPACNAARTLLSRWTNKSASQTRSNIGSHRGRSAVLETLDAEDIRRLCPVPLRSS